MPIPLEPICEYLGACVVYLDRISDNSKAAGRFLGNGRIEIIKDLPKNLFRSTLAHELGHLALHHDTRSKWDEIDSFQDPDPHEKEAWDFAGEILVPDKILKPLLLNIRKPEFLPKNSWSAQILCGYSFLNEVYLAKQSSSSFKYSSFLSFLIFFSNHHNFCFVSEPSLTSGKIQLLVLV